MGRRRRRKRFLRRLERTLMDFAVQALAELAGHLLGDALEEKKKNKSKVPAANRAQDSRES